MSNKIYAGVGTRNNIPKFALEKMEQFARELAERGYTLRSGAASGSDSAFERGCDSVNGLKEIWLPWKKYEKHISLLTPSKESFIFTAPFHPNWSRLASSVKCLHARNAHIVMGADLDTPVDFVIYYRSQNPKTFGTDHTLRIARAFNIPTYEINKALELPEG